jgi:hypothetical protein
LSAAGYEASNRLTQDAEKAYHARKAAGRCRSCGLREHCGQARG